MVNETKKDLKKLLKLKNQLKKQEEFSKSAWESYGSELAGNFADGEYKVGTQIKIIGGLLNDKNYSNK